MVVFNTPGRNVTTAVLGAADGACDGLDEGCAFVGTAVGCDVVAIAILLVGRAVGDFEIETLVHADGHAEVSCLDDGAASDESKAITVGEFDVRC